jgi:hypothetical protein
VDYVDLSAIGLQIKAGLESKGSGYPSVEIGRGKTESLNEARLLSRNHATLSLVNGSLMIADHESANGTLVKRREDSLPHKIQNRPPMANGVEWLAKGSEVLIPIDKDTLDEIIYLRLKIDSIY